MSTEEVLLLAGLFVTVVNIVVSAIVSYLVARKYNEVAGVRATWKYQQYERIIDCLIDMKRILGSVVIAYEWAVQNGDENGVVGEEECTAYDRFKEQVERVLVGGDYIISEEALSALSELMKRLPPCLPMYIGAAPVDELAKDLPGLRRLLSQVESCLEVVSAEARCDLEME